jgi:hypothetical protein
MSGDCCVAAEPNAERCDIPTPISTNKIRTTVIRQYVQTGCIIINYTVPGRVDNGYIVEVGCKTFVILGADNLVRLLSDYLLDPGGVEKKFYANELSF